ncbi:MAG: DUF1330 domain-containing protein [Pseudomonadales bacterium]|nr:DUF1330 domain-containing protein [Pseudomonadales bacterium]
MLNITRGFKEQYLKHGLPLVKKHGAKVLSATSKGIIKEGKFPPGRVEIIQFLSMEQAEAFYADPEYVALIGVREKLGTSVFGFFPGLTH